MDRSRLATFAADDLCCFTGEIADHVLRDRLVDEVLQGSSVLLWCDG